MTTRALIAGGLAVLTLAACSDSDDRTTAGRSAIDPGSGGADTTAAASDSMAPVPATAVVAAEAAEPVPPTPSFEDPGINPEVVTADDSLSTFAIDVDTGSYSIARSYIGDGFLPERASVRTEEYVNYFEQGYEAPADGGLAVYVDGTTVPFLGDGSKRIVRVGLQGEVVAPENRKPARLTFVIDVSGSMADANKLDLVKPTLATMVGQLRPDDTAAIVTYGDSASVVLEPTAASDADTIVSVIDGLVTNSSTNAEAGLVLGYNLAREQFDEGAINRVVLLSDGVANVGATGPDAILARVHEEAGDGIQLVTVGFGMGEYNDVLMEQLADDGDGFYAYVDGPAEAERLFVNQLTGTLQTIALDAKVQVEFDPATVASYRLLGYENRAVADDDFDDDSVDGGEVGAGHRVVALYEITLVEGVAPDAVLATATTRWLDPDTNEPTERAATLTGSGLAPAFDESAPHLQLDVMVAAWAETLRGAPWSETMTLQGVADNSARLAELLPDDAQVAEFVALTATAAQLG